MKDKNGRCTLVESLALGSRRAPFAPRLCLFKGVVLDLR